MMSGGADRCSCSRDFAGEGDRAQPVTERRRRLHRRFGWSPSAELRGGSAPTASTISGRRSTSAPPSTIAEALAVRRLEMPRASRPATRRDLQRRVAARVAQRARGGWSSSARLDALLDRASRAPASSSLERRREILAQRLQPAALRGSPSRRRARCRRRDSTPASGWISIRSMPSASATRQACWPPAPPKHCKRVAGDVVAARDRDLA